MRDDSQDLADIAGTGSRRRVEVTRLINAPIDKVWRALTDPDEKRLWDEPCEIEPMEGGRFKHESGQDGTIKVYQPPHIFEFTWNDNDAEPGLVRFDLVATDDHQTRLTVVQYVSASDVVPAAAGWHGIVDNLVHYLATGKPFPAERYKAHWLDLQARYEQAVT